MRHIQDPHYADDARCFGFQNGLFPSEGGLHYSLTTLGRLSEVDGDTVTIELEHGDTVEIAIQYLNQLIAGAVALIRAAHFFTPQAWQNALLCPDGMIHDAASRMRCTAVQDSCYQPTSATAPRPCPAKEKDPPRRGCQCDTSACAAICQHAPARDAQARCVWYERSNQPSAHQPNASADPSAPQPGKGELRYGYRTLPFQFAEPSRRFSFVLLDDLLPTDGREENPAAAQDVEDSVHNLAGRVLLFPAPCRLALQQMRLNLLPLGVRQIGRIGKLTSNLFLQQGRQPATPLIGERRIASTSSSISGMSARAM